MARRLMALTVAIAGLTTATPALCQVDTSTYRPYSGPSPLDMIGQAQRIELQRQQIEMQRLHLEQQRLQMQQAEQKRELERQQAELNRRRLTERSKAKK